MRDMQPFADMVILAIKASLAPVLERLVGGEQAIKDLRDRFQDVPAMRDRILALETKTVPLPAPVELGPSLSDIELLVRQQQEPLIKELAALRVQMAVMDARPQMPGPPGEKGEPGRDGIDGLPGLAGLSFEGVYQEGKAYERGSMVTWGGSMWHCNEPTSSKPQDGVKVWTLAIKRGRDGKDGRDAQTLPVVSLTGVRP